jgi:transcription antitermination factor NusB
MKNYTRTDERTKAMQAFYQVFLYLENKEEFDATDVLLNIFGETDIKKVPVYAKAIYAYGLDHLDEVKDTIQSHLVNWQFDRLDNVAKSILFVGVTEGLYLQVAPRKVVINEGVKLAKNYLKEGDHKFINAVLDKSIPEYEPKA